MTKKKYYVDFNDEADDWALERMGKKRRTDLVDLVGILLVCGSAIYGWLSTGFSLTRATSEAGWAFLAYLTLRFIYSATNMYESYLALGYRTKVIDQKLSSIEEKLNEMKEGLDEIKRELDAL